MSVAPRRMFQVFAPWVWVPWWGVPVGETVSFRVDLYSTKKHIEKPFEKQNKQCFKGSFSGRMIMIYFFNLGATHGNIYIYMSRVETMANHKGKNACHVSTERVHAMYSLQVPSEVDSRDGGSAMAGIEVRQIHGCIYFFHSLNHWTFTVVVHAQDKNYPVESWARRINFINHRHSRCTIHYHPTLASTLYIYIIYHLYFIALHCRTLHDLSSMRANTYSCIPTCIYTWYTGIKKCTLTDTGDFRVTAAENQFGREGDETHSLYARIAVKR